MKLARVPFLLAAAVCLLSGIGAGLGRLGLALPGPVPELAALHGPLMVSGFFGTLIGLERAVAHGGSWSYLAPLAAGCSGILALSGQVSVAAWVATLASALFTLVSADLARRHLADFTLVLCVAAFAWCVGNVAWASGQAPARVFPWFVAFLVLTIFAERRELGRVLAPGPRAGRAFVGVVGVILAGAALVDSAHDEERRVLAIGLIGMTAWLAVFDVARHTVKKRGLTRFMAVALLAGYFWLGVGALGMLGAGPVAAGAGYDAFVHALMLGFVFSMVFAHAPVIFPAVLGAPLAYSPIFYVHLSLLQLSLGARVLGDAAGQPLLRQLGAVGNAAAIVVFLLVSLRAVFSARGRRSRS